MSRTFTVVLSAYCGMKFPMGEELPREQARAKVARRIRLHRNRRDGQVLVLEKGREWELCEPEGSLMVPDWCGVLRINEKAKDDERPGDDEGGE